jgi:hypothetical protein
MTRRMPLLLLLAVSSPWALADDPKASAPPTVGAGGTVSTDRITPNTTPGSDPAAVAAAGGMTVLSMLCIAVACLLGLAAYVAPSIIAFSRRHPNAGAICAVNLLLGWFFIGWVVALVWSFTAIDQDRRYR